MFLLPLHLGLLAFVTTKKDTDESRNAKSYWKHFLQEVGEINVRDFRIEILAIVAVSQVNWLCYFKRQVTVHPKTFFSTAPFFSLSLFTLSVI